MTSSFGQKLKITIFGHSHGNAIGLVADGFPLGTKIDMDKLNEFMKRRAPGSSKYTTRRREDDQVEFIAGVEGDRIVANTICAIIKNKDTISSDYESFRDIPRPSHADYVSNIKYQGLLDMRGSGPFSARLTAPLCIGGAIALQILEERGIEVRSHLKQVGGVHDVGIDYVNPDMEGLSSCSQKAIPVIDHYAEEKIKNLLEEVKANQDSVGGEVECVVTGLPVGLGEPNYKSFESQIASLVYAVPGTRAISFGRGFEAATMLGSDHNDEFQILDGKVVTKTNNAGGLVGGITNGMPLIFSVVMKPTASISKEQTSISLKDMKEEKLRIRGRHDPCIALRALPIIEALAALVILDFMEINNGKL